MHAAQILIYIKIKIFIIIIITIIKMWGQRQDWMAKKTYSSSRGHDSIPSAHTEWLMAAYNSSLHD